MKTTPLFPFAVMAALASMTLSGVAADPIEHAMKLAHKAPKGEKKLGEKIVEGTATEEEVKKVLEAYLAVGDAKPPKGDHEAFKQKWAKLVSATQDVAAKKPGAAEAYKEAVACKACHSEHKGK